MWSKNTSRTLIWLTGLNLTYGCMSLSHQQSHSRCSCTKTGLSGLQLKNTATKWTVRICKTCSCIWPTTRSIKWTPVSKTLKALTMTPGTSGLGLRCCGGSSKRGGTSKRSTTRSRTSSWKHFWRFSQICFITTGLAVPERKMQRSTQTRCALSFLDSTFCLTKNASHIFWR